MARLNETRNADSRCVHLDFHTSELIPDVGAKFDKEKFAKTLKDAKINSVTVFAKCHHGCFYYKGSKFFVHPGMQGSLLDEQLDACKKAGVSAKIYISAGIDEHISRQHPEWLRREKYGEDQDATGFRRLCFNSEYLDILKEQTREVVERYKPDGVFFDIISTWPCYCDNCLAEMKRRGLDPKDEKQAQIVNDEVNMRYFKEINAVVKSVSPNTQIVHNVPYHICTREYIDVNDRIELESLPTGGWGYDNFPAMVAYLRRQNKNVVGMTGKFHRSWGEFGGYKYPEALRFEAALDLAYGTGMSVGDQLHPSGKLDDYTYEMIGDTFNWFEKRQKYSGGEYLPELALYSPSLGIESDQDARTGASRILLEDKYLFDMIGDDEIDKKYPLIIIATARPLSAAEVEKFKIYADNGGKILAQGSAAGSLIDGGVDLGFTEITADDLTPCYYVSKYPLKAGNGVPLVVFGKSWNIKASGEVLCDKLSPYFKREGSNFCSHAHTPCDYDKVSPAITVGKHGIAVASDLFTLYATDGGMTAKVLITPLIERLLNNKKTVITDLPSSGKVTLYRKGNGLTLHLVYANTVVRGGGNASVEVIEDIITISCVNVSLKAEKPVKVVLRPDGKELPFIYENGTVNFSLKDFNCYAAIEFIY